MSTIKKSFTARTKEFLLSYIEEKHLQPGDFMPTQRDVAAMMNVSQKIAQVALDELEEEGILIRRIGRGTMLAKRHEIVPRTSCGGRNIFVLVPNIQNPQFSEFVSEVERVLLQRGRFMRLITFASSHSIRELVNAMVVEGCGGIISTEMPPLIRSFIAQYEIPAVVIRLKNVRKRSHLLHEIVLDLKAQAQLLCEHLLSRGYRRFYLAGGQLSMDDLCYRFQMMRKILMDSGAEIRVICEKNDCCKAWSYEELGKNLAMQILDQYEPQSAVAFYNTVRVLGAMKVFQRHGKRIPDDLGIASFDNIFGARLVEPEITVTDARYLEAAHQAAELVLSQESERQCVRIPPILCCGRSVGCLRKEKH